MGRDDRRSLAAAEKREGTMAASTSDLSNRDRAIDLAVSQILELDRLQVIQNFIQLPFRLLRCLFRFRPHLHRDRLAV